MLKEIISNIVKRIRYRIIKNKLDVSIAPSSVIYNVEFSGGGKIEDDTRVIGDKLITIGSNIYINAGCHFLGNINIGNDVMIGPKVTIWSRDHGIDENILMRLQANLDSPINIGDDVWIGAGAIILKGVSVKNGAVVGAGSVVTKDVCEGTIVAGNPARVIGVRR
ncbi:DapH/DapD/GlmU-related protein [Enterovibrio norvegicus]|uniref:DapH/DapD/GlmU-related protein n=1 Tax=Enterovibrio norvegicus TaxID=188144 RepID=UPI000C82072B|nr:DapH/DapD/GlmU-related protein [Enterovibrio norvegicus]PMN71091.1 transacetylase [Enterovibrio norvegicus]